MVMYIPGDRDMPEWWGPADQAILDGEVAKLAELPQVGTSAPRRPMWRTPRHIGTLLVLGALLGMVLLFAFTPTRPAPEPSHITVPTTDGPPGPNGGPRFTTMPVP